MLHRTIILCCIATAAAAAVAEARPPEKLKRLLEKATGPITLKLGAVDLAAATVEAIVSGVTHEVSARMFVFHNDRNRHFIATHADCAVVDGTDTIRCRLELPRFYLRKGRVVGFTAHIHKREYEADPKLVEEKLNRPLDAPEPPPPPSSGDADGGVADACSPADAKGQDAASDARKTKDDPGL